MLLAGQMVVNWGELQVESRAVVTDDSTPVTVTAVQFVYCTALLVVIVGKQPVASLHVN